MMNTPNTENEDASADAEADVVRWRVYLRSVPGPNWAAVFVILMEIGR
jgi:hypothetical protein